ncbi:MAG: hypothetical protein GY869_31345, partial [Planctomycetes bacterium]|nr:hypothetical protein [Planctomycetota bacterium]
VFCSIMQPLPIGAKLKLESGQWGVVVRHNQGQPFQPDLVVAYDQLGDPLGKDQLVGPFTLGARNDIRVVNFGDENIEFLNDLDFDNTEIDPAEITRHAEQSIMDFSYP